MLSFIIYTQRMAYLPTNCSYYLYRSPDICHMGHVRINKHDSPLVVDYKW